jgi:hypothetical protein
VRSQACGSVAGIDAELLTQDTSVASQESVA